MASIRKSLAYALAVVTLASLAVLLYLVIIRPPRTFPQGKVVSIAQGQSLSSIASELKQNNIIRSPFWLINFIIFFNRDRKVVGGDYYFDQPVNVYQVAKIIGQGQFNMDQLKTTIPEGSN